MGKDQKDSKGGVSNKKVWYDKASPERTSGDAGTSARNTVDGPAENNTIKQLVRFLARLAAEADYQELLRTMDGRNGKDQPQEKA